MKPKRTRRIWPRRDSTGYSLPAFNPFGGFDVGSVWIPSWLPCRTRFDKTLCNDYKISRLMQILQNRDLSPPDFFRYVHAETGHTSSAMDWYTWQTLIRDHRRDNGLPEITPAQAEEQLCQTLPPEWCQHSENNRRWVNTRLSWKDIVEGVKAYAKFALSGFESVSQEEANRRARLCSGCYLSVPLQGCGACTALATVITGSVAQKKTPYDDRLSRKACAACKCPTRSIVHFPLSLLEQADTPENQAAFTPFCWRFKDGPNYLPQAA